jgi:hypothetical protein
VQVPGVDAEALLEELPGSIKAPRLLLHYALRLIDGRVCGVEAGPTRQQLQARTQVTLQDTSMKINDMLML